MSDFRRKLLGIDSEDECCGCTFEYRPEYDREEFISTIMEIGASFYNKSDITEDEINDVLHTVSLHLNEIYHSQCIVRLQDYRIAIAIPQFITNAPKAIGNELRVVEDIFCEVSGPGSTVLIIDCEKEYLRETYLGIGEDEWLA